MLRKILIFLLLALPAFGQTNYTRMLAGVNYQSGASYSLQPADNTKLVSMTNSGSAAVCLSSPAALCSGVAAGSGSFYGAGSVFSINSSSATTTTITCQSSCTINGSTTLTINAGTGADIYGDGTNFAAVVGFGFAPPNSINSYPQLYTGVAASSAAAGATIGLVGGGTATGCCSQSVSLVNPTAANPYQMETYSFGGASTSGVIGIHQAENGNTGDWFIRGIWRMTQKIQLNAIGANTRYYWGLGVWGNGSSLGTNATNVLGTTAFSTDTPNHTFVGWRYSATTDTTYKALVIQAGASPTTVLVDTGVTTDTNMHTFDVTLDVGNTTYTFYVDGVQKATAAASTITFAPAYAGDVQATMFFTGDNKNTATSVSLTFANMFLSLRQ